MDASPLVSRQFLTFCLDQEIFAIDVASVRQVLTFQMLTRVPQVPEYVRGVINLRGDVVPVLDARLKLGLGRTEPTADTCVVIAEIGTEDHRGTFGVLVDSVREVIELSPEVVVPPPELATGAGASLIRGLAKRSDDLVMIMDLDGLLSDETHCAVEAARNAQVSRAQVDVG